VAGNTRSDKRWTLLDVVEMTGAYWQPIYEAHAERKAKHMRLAEDQEFLRAIAELEEAGL